MRKRPLLHTIHYDDPINGLRVVNLHVKNNNNFYVEHYKRKAYRPVNEMPFKYLPEAMKYLEQYIEQLNEKNIRRELRILKFKNLFMTLVFYLVYPVMLLYHYIKSKQSNN